MAIMSEETFGPVIPVTRFRDADEAVALAESGVFGLSAAVLAGSMAEAEAVAVRLNAGAVSINDGALTSMIWEAEKSSWVRPASGRRGWGESGFLRFFRRRPSSGRRERPSPRGLCRGDAAVRTFAEAMPNIHAHEGEWEGSYRHVGRRHAARRTSHLDLVRVPADGPYAYVQHNRLSWPTGAPPRTTSAASSATICCTWDTDRFHGYGWETREGC
jgi:hypothetical protein